jgi:NADH-quinone oxidoreductase subunit L
MLWILKNLWLIPALPLAAAGLIAVMKQRQRKPAAALAIGSLTFSFLLSCCAFAPTLRSGAGLFREVYNFRWFDFGTTSLQLGWVLDPLTAVMLLMVTFVGTLIFIYSVGYMAHDENFTRFFCFLSLFAAAMLGIIIANSLLLLFISWELVGLASYLLIGFWFHKPSAATAAKKAFITTRIGDMGFLIGMLWLYSQTGTLLFYDNGNGCLEQSALTKLVTTITAGGMVVSTAIALLIFCGAMGKSGQVPLHVWLPDAMEGPTPVSALIHAATMVAAGVFLVARVYPLMEATPEQFASASPVAVVERTLTPALSLSEREREKVIQPLAKSQLAVNSERAFERVRGADLPPAPNAALPLPKGEGRGEGEHDSRKPAASFALKTVTWVGAITAVFAALIAVAQTDIKRILAYSTVSQLGYMMMGLGVGGVSVGMFHLITHAFFKALLFLGAGSVIHGCHDEQDICRMGGLRKFMPVTFATYAIGMMALCGVPIFFSGFWSKDEILHAAHGWPTSQVPFYLGIAGAFLTAFYMTRQVVQVFFGNSRVEFGTVTVSEKRTHEHGGGVIPEYHQAQFSSDVHESPRIMTVPLVVLAVGAMALGFLGTPAWPWLHSYLTGHELRAEFGKLLEWSTLSLMLISAVIVAAGIGIAWFIYARKITCDANEPDPLERAQPAVFRLLHRKFYFDELYEATVIRLNAFFATLSDWLDRVIWNGFVQLVSLITLGFSHLSRAIDQYIVNLGFDGGCDSLRSGARGFARLQSGQVQNYLRVIGIGLAVLVLALLWGCRL